MSYKVRIDAFEGPFDLLVYLIETSKMSIRDIKISEITRQYIDYINEMKSMEIDVATEFIVLAASLIEIKTKMLLPARENEQAEVDVEDPKTELIAKLIEYKRFKGVAAMLSDSFDNNGMFHSKPQEDLSRFTENPDEILNLRIDEFRNAFEAFLLKKQRLEEVRKNYTRVEREKMTLENQMSYMTDIAFRRFDSGEERINLKELIPGEKETDEVVVTFVSLLQMMRDKIFDAEQNINYGEIYIRKGIGEEADALNQGEEF